MFDLSSILSEDWLQLAIKIPLLIILFIFFIFTIVVVTRVSVLKRAVHIRSSSASSLLMLFAILYSMAALFLFITALVIV